MSNSQNNQQAGSNEAPKTPAPGPATPAPSRIRAISRPPSPVSSRSKLYVFFSEVTPGGPRRVAAATVLPGRSEAAIGGRDENVR